MIKIDTNLFDWDTIKDIYCNEEGALYCQKPFKEKSLVIWETRTWIVSRLFHEWFYDAEEQPVFEKISSFLSMQKSG